MIALATVGRECLLERWAADKITRVFVRMFGDKRASVPLLGSGFLLAVPVFFDTVFYFFRVWERYYNTHPGTAN